MSILYTVYYIPCVLYRANVGDIANAVVHPPELLHLSGQEGLEPVQSRRLRTCPVKKA